MIQQNLKTAAVAGIFLVGVAVVIPFLLFRVVLPLLVVGAVVRFFRKAKGQSETKTSNSPFSVQGLNRQSLFNSFKQAQTAKNFETSPRVIYIK